MLVILKFKLTFSQIARGTGEPGPFGVVVGDLLVGAVAKAVNGSRGYAVQVCTYSSVSYKSSVANSTKYPANLNMSVSAPTGTDDAIIRLNKQHAECPNQKFALVGYSQGASVMHGIFAEKLAPYPGSAPERQKLSQDVIPSILALVMFGDPGFKNTGIGPLGTQPKFPPALFERLRENCAPRDPVCDPSIGGFENHLNYVQNPWQKDSADFIIAAFQGKPLPKAPRTLEDVGMGPKGAASAATPASSAAATTAKGPKMMI
jgi:cutinase